VVAGGLRAGFGHGMMTRPFLLLVAGAVAIGFAPIFVRLVSAGPVATAFWRMALAVPVLWIVASRQNISVAGPFRSAIIWLAGLAFALDLTAWHFSIRLTSVTNATLLANCAVLLVPLLSWLFLRRGVRLGTFGYAVLAFAGIVLLSGPRWTQQGPSYWAMRSLLLRRYFTLFT
jgi:drug/metabolite transporter (DMT)-like permease